MLLRSELGPATKQQPGERSSSEYTPEEITIARAVDKLRVDADGLGWIRGMEPKAAHDETGPGEVARLKRAIVSIAYATLSAVDSSGTLTMDPNHRESVSLAIKGLCEAAAPGGQTGGYDSAAGIAIPLKIG